MTRFYQHLWRGEEPCRECKDERNRTTKLAPNYEERKKRNAQLHEIRRRARLRLTKEFPERYQEILEEERHKFDEAEIMRLWGEVKKDG